MAWTPLGLPAFLFVITVVVFFHELGHFLVARACGVKVDVFSIGFGTRDFRLERQKRHALEDELAAHWRLCEIRRRRQCRQHARSCRRRPHERGRAHADPRLQAALAARRGRRGGTVANFILAVLLFTGLIFHNGHTVLAPIIGDVVKGSAAEAAGMHAGDRVTAIDGTRITDFEQMPQIIAVSGGQNLTIDLVRDGQPLSVHVMPRATRMRDALGDMGTNVVIGVQPSPTAPITTEYYSLPAAFGAASVETWDIMHTTVQGIAQMVRGYASADQFRGPLGIAKMTRQVATFGFHGAASAGGCTFRKHWAGQPFSHSAARRRASSVLCMRSCFGAAAG